MGSTVAVFGMATAAVDSYFLKNSVSSTRGISGRVSASTGGIAMKSLKLCPETLMESERSLGLSAPNGTKISYSLTVSDLYRRGKPYERCKMYS